MRSSAALKGDYQINTQFWSILIFGINLFLGQAYAEPEPYLCLSLFREANLELRTESFALGVRGLRFPETFKVAGFGQTVGRTGRLESLEEREIGGTFARRYIPVRDVEHAEVQLTARLRGNLIQFKRSATGWDRKGRRFIILPDHDSNLPIDQIEYVTQVNTYELSIGDAVTLASSHILGIFLLGMSGGEVQIVDARAMLYDPINMWSIPLTDPDKAEIQAARGLKYDRAIYRVESFVAVASAPKQGALDPQKWPAQFLIYRRDGAVAVITREIIERILLPLSSRPHAYPVPKELLTFLRPAI